MADNMKQILRKSEGLIEIILLSVVYYFIWRQMYQKSNFPAFYGRGKYVLAAVYGALIMILFHYSEGFKFGHLKLIDVAVAQWISLAITNFITYFQLSLIANHMINAWPMIVLMILDMFIAFGCTYLYTVFYHRVTVPQNLLMVYTEEDESGILLKDKMSMRSDKYNIRKMMNASLGFDAIAKEISKYDALVICNIPTQMRNDLLKYCYQIGKKTYITPKVSDILLAGTENIHLFDSPLMLMRGTGLNLEQRFFKRTMDIVLCLIALAVLWPIMLIIAAAIKLEDRGPVFYTQKRCTIGNREFDILKFRSMIVDAEKDGKSIPATDYDPRITKVGRMIRATRLDELPQILNILKGDMSIVGPRPERIEHVKKYTQEIPEFAFRSKVKGGLTGYAQIYGKYNTTAYDKLRLDLMYIGQYSLILDCKLILMTIGTMFKKESTEGFDKQMKILEKNEEKVS